MKHSLGKSKITLNKTLDIRPSLNEIFNLLSANFTKWSNTLKQLVAKLPTNCLSVFDHFVGLALAGLTVKTLQESQFPWKN